jgi:hypothetical protein
MRIKILNNMAERLVAPALLRRLVQRSFGEVGSSAKTEAKRQQIPAALGYRLIASQ